MWQMGTRPCDKVCEKPLGASAPLHPSFLAYYVRAKEENVANGTAPFPKNLRKLLGTSVSLYSSFPALFCLRQKRTRGKWELALAKKFATSCRSIGFPSLFPFWLFLSAPRRKRGKWAWAIAENSRDPVGALISLRFSFLASAVCAKKENVAKGNGSLRTHWPKTGRGIRFTLLFIFGLFGLRQRKRARRKRERALAKMRQVLEAVFQLLFPSFAAYSARAEKGDVANEAAPFRRNLRNSSKSIRFTWLGNLRNFRRNFRIVLSAPKEQIVANGNGPLRTNKSNTSRSIRLALLFIFGVFRLRQRERARRR